MTGLEQMAIGMLQKMTGLSPEEMTGLANKAVDLLQSLDSRLTNMEASQARIEAYLMPAPCDNPVELLKGPENVEN